MCSLPLALRDSDGASPPSIAERLPAEILCDTFARLAWSEGSDDRYPPTHTRDCFAFSHVCSYWRAVALADTTLWTRPCFHTIECAQTMINRAGDQLLDLSILEENDGERYRSRAVTPIPRQRLFYKEKKEAAQIQRHLSNRLKRDPFPVTFGLLLSTLYRARTLYVRASPSSVAWAPLHSLVREAPHLLSMSLQHGMTDGMGTALVPLPDKIQAPQLCALYLWNYHPPWTAAMFKNLTIIELCHDIGRFEGHAPSPLSKPLFGDVLDALERCPLLKSFVVDIPLWFGDREAVLRTRVVHLPRLQVLDITLYPHGPSADLLLACIAPAPNVRVDVSDALTCRKSGEEVRFSVVKKTAQYTARMLRACNAPPPTHAAFRTAVLEYNPTNLNYPASARFWGSGINVCLSFDVAGPSHVRAAFHSYAQLPMHALERVELTSQKDLYEPELDELEPLWPVLADLPCLHTIVLKDSAGIFFANAWDVRGARAFPALRAVIMDSDRFETPSPASSALLRVLQARADDGRRLHELRISGFWVQIPEDSNSDSAKKDLRAIRDSWVERVSALVDKVAIKE
jgi:hypothetical protein